MRASITLAVAFLCCWTPTPSHAYRHSSPHHGQGRKIPMDSIKTLTFYDGKLTEARRTERVPQMTCVGQECRRYQPDVAVCQSLGDWQWKCQADLPPSMRLGRVEVSCEGYEAPSDPYVLKAHSSFSAEDDHLRFKGSGFTFQHFLDFVFPVLFLASCGWILWGFISTLMGWRGGGRGVGGGGGGGGWPRGGGPGGGWGPGWGGPDSNDNAPPPPPYHKHQFDNTASSSSSSSSSSPSGSANWRPGFWTGLATGVGGYLLANRQRNSNRRAYDPYMNDAGGGLGAGWAGGGGGMPRNRYFDDDDRGVGSSSLRSSTGYGGTRNR